MSTLGGKSYSTPKNVNLLQGQLRFGATKTSNPFSADSTGRGIYVNSSNQLVYWNGTSVAVVSGTGTAGSLDGGLNYIS